MKRLILFVLLLPAISTAEIIKSLCIPYEFTAQNDEVKSMTCQVITDDTKPFTIFVTSGTVRMRLSGVGGQVTKMDQIELQIYIDSVYQENLTAKQQEKSATDEFESKRKAATVVIK